jgi:hypothetical protein
MKHFTVLTAAVILVTAVTTESYQSVAAFNQAHYNQGYNDCYNRITVPGSHTADYLQGCQDGSAAARIPQLRQPQRTSSDWTLKVSS